MYRHDNDVSLSVIGIMVVIGLFLILFVSCVGGNAIENEIRNYELITVNGVTYDTDLITGVDYYPMGDKPDIVKIYLQDGTIIRTSRNSYTLSNMKADTQNVEEYNETESN